MRILVVGDAADESHHLASAITSRGFDVVNVTSVRDALLVLNESDAVLLGTERSKTGVMAAVEAIRTESDLPLVVLAARPTSDMCVEVLLAGADDYLARLSSIDEVTARIRALLRRRRRGRASYWHLAVDGSKIDLGVTCQPAITPS